MCCRCSVRLMNAIRKDRRNGLQLRVVVKNLLYMDWRVASCQGNGDQDLQRSKLGANGLFYPSGNHLMNVAIGVRHI